jgi:hypothetical protein
VTPIRAAGAAPGRDPWGYSRLSTLPPQVTSTEYREYRPSPNAVQHLATLNTLEQINKEEAKKRNVTNKYRNCLEPINKM